MKTAAHYIAEAKEKLGNRWMSDRELGEKLGGLSQPYIAGAKSGKMSDPLAMKLADVLHIEAGELLMVARVEREKDPAVRAALARYAGKVLASVPSKAAHVLAGMAVALTLALPSPAEAAVVRANCDSVGIMSTRMRAWLRRFLASSRPALA